jgi:hypothetical protein
MRSVEPKTRSAGSTRSRRSSAAGQAARASTTAFVKFQDNLDDLTRILIRFHRPRPTLKHCGEYGPPVDADLPRASFVGEEHHVVMALIDVPEKVQDDLKRLTDVDGITSRGLLDAAIEKASAVGDERPRPAAHAVLMLARTGLRSGGR